MREELLKEISYSQSLSLFTSSTSTYLPPKFTMPSLNKFDGNDCPISHIKKYVKALQLQSYEHSQWVYSFLKKCQIYIFKTKNYLHQIFFFFDTLTSIIYKLVYLYGYCSFIFEYFYNFFNILLFFSSFHLFPSSSLSPSLR